jgi:hypothetical protein
MKLLVGLNILLENLSYALQKKLGFQVHTVLKRTTHKDQYTLLHKLYFINNINKCMRCFSHTTVFKWISHITWYGKLSKIVSIT